MRTADFNTDDFGHAAVIAEEVLGPLGGDVQRIFAFRNPVLSVTPSAATT
jgi:hypothetical protein